MGPSPGISRSCKVNCWVFFPAAREILFLSQMSSTSYSSRLFILVMELWCPTLAGILWHIHLCLNEQFRCFFWPLSPFSLIFPSRKEITSASCDLILDRRVVLSPFITVLWRNQWKEFTQDGTKYRIGAKSPSLGIYWIGIELGLPSVTLEVAQRQRSWQAWVLFFFSLVAWYVVQSASHKANRSETPLSFER